MKRPNQNRALKITRPQIRVMLDFLGVPFAQQGKTVKDTQEILHTYEVASPEEYKRAYEIIVLHKLPEGDDPKATQFHDMGKLIAEHMSSHENRAIAGVKAEAEKQIAMAHEKVQEAAHKYMAEAAENYRPISVKVGNQKAKVMKGVFPEEFSKLLQLAQQRKNILMVGPAGCGKTYIAAKIAEALSLDYSSQSCSAGISESLLSGWLLPVGDSGKFSYVPSEFVRLYENGGVFLLDEIDASDPNVLVFINAALANESFVIPQRFDKPLVIKHKDFVAIAAANTYGGGADAMYHARNALDAATLDRFKIGTVPMNYSEPVEQALVDPEILAWGINVRRKIAEHKLRRIMSTRVLIDASDMKNGQDWKLADIKKSYYADWSPEELSIMRAG